MYVGAFINYVMNAVCLKYTVIGSMFVFGDVK